jgi:hypothetical protein
MRIYIAGQYTTGDPAINVKRAIDAAEEVVKLGHVPFIPHLTHFWHMIYAHEYEFWMEQDFEWLKQCQALLRLPGDSPGADKEVYLADKLGLVIFWSIKDIAPKIKEVLE